MTSVFYHPDGPATPGTEPALFCLCTPESRPAWHPSTGDWRMADQGAAEAYAKTLDLDAYATNHAPTKGFLCLWFGLRRHGKADHTARVQAMRLKMLEAGLSVRRTSVEGCLSGLLVIDLAAPAA